MELWKPDQTFYPSPTMAMRAPRERLGYVVAFDPKSAGRRANGNGRHDALCVLDLDPSSPSFSQVVGRVEMPNVGDELHHFGWNACSAALCPYAPHPHVERRYLLVPGLRSSRIHIIDTKPDPRNPRIVKVISAEEIAARTGYSRPHTIHCGPDAIYVSALGAPNGDGPGGIFLLDHDSFDVLGRFEVDRGPQFLAYDFWWHLGYDVGITSEWGTPNMIEDGLNPDLLLKNQYGHAIHVWDLRKRKHLQTIELGPEHQMTLELRPAHDPTKSYGFLGVVVSTKDLSASIWTWHLDQGKWAARKVIEIPPEPADADLLPPALKPFKAVPPLITDIILSLDDKFLYVACWGTGEVRQYDVSDPFKPKLAGSARLGGIVARTPHPKAGKVNGAMQMVELSRDGRRLYASNSLYSSWDEQFYPEGINGWVAKLDINPAGGLAVDPNFFVPFKEERPHQIHLEGGDCSSDSYCFP
jgi:selenium-binding protein 1